MAYVPTPLNAKRVPTQLDLAFVDANALTLSVAAPRRVNLSYEDQAMRPLAALHEAAHFVAMIEFGDHPIKVVVAMKPTTTRKGCAGMVFGAKTGNYENEGFVTLVGSTFEFLMMSAPGHSHMSPAFYHDAAQAETDWRNWYTYRMDAGKLGGPAEKHVAAAFDDGRVAQRAQDYIHSRWQLIDLCATVFLIYGDRNGEVARPVIDALHDAVAERMKTPWPTQHRSSSPTALRNSLPPDVLSIWRKHSPHTDLEDWPEVA